jgi:hypothetical protein
MPDIFDLATGRWTSTTRQFKDTFSVGERVYFSGELANPKRRYRNEPGIVIENSTDFPLTGRDYGVVLVQLSDGTQVHLSVNKLRRRDQAY